ncbi:MAG: hypothetical protein PHV16_00050 [Candidatus Nanoarchaeia archaeon]|nr:hypothetical protein [Candidatus Nanoarchaeia archaeon]
MSLIRKFLFGFICFSLGYYMGGGCENKTIESEIKISNYANHAYYQTIDERVTKSIEKQKGIEKIMYNNLDYK